MDFKKIKHLVFSADAEDSVVVQKAKESKLQLYRFEDSRSAVYCATGIAAQNLVPVIVCINGSNASRSAYSGMTEAYYRQLPVILITTDKQLDYSEELGDVVFGHYCVSNVDEISSLLSKNLPIHIEINANHTELKKQDANTVIKCLADILTEKEYLYVGNNVQTSEYNFRCKVIYGGMPNCYEGALANVLGASLSKVHERYIGILSEKEFVHDMNTLGNININDRLLYIVVCRTKNLLILNYAKSLGFITESIYENDIQRNIIMASINNNKKTLIVVYKEKE